MQVKSISRSIGYSKVTQTDLHPEFPLYSTHEQALPTIIYSLLFTCGLITLELLFSQSDLNVLVFSKTEGFRHGSISNGQTALRNMAEEKGFSVDFTENAGDFTAEKLAQYQVLVFLNTTGDILDETQQNAMQAWYRAGGGFIGIHSAADTEYGLALV